MKSIGRTFYFFFQNYTASTCIVVFLLIVSGIFEAIGVAAFLPFLQIFLEGRNSIESVHYAPVDEFINAHGITLDFVTVGAFIVTAITAKALIMWLAMYKVSQTVSKIATDFRDRFLYSLLHANWRFFTNHPLGKSLNAVATESLRGSLTFVSATRFLANCIQFFVYLGSAFILSWQVSIGIIIVGIITALLLWGFIKMARSAGNQQTSATKDMLGQMGDILQGIKPLRAMALQDRFMGLLHDLSRDLQKSQIGRLLATQSLRIFYEPLMVLSAVAGLYVALNLGALSGSTLVLMMILFLRVMASLNSAQSEYQRLAQEESALWSLLEAIEETEKAAEVNTGSKNAPQSMRQISFENVGFSHEKRKTLHGLNLSFEHGKLSVLMGESGSGKTTVIDLISGFYAPEEGVILVDDVNLQNFEKRSWRRQIGFVPQEVFLFNDSIYNNIVMGRDGLEDKDVWQVLEAVGAKEFVEALDDKLHAPVGENGRLLSGGQRQRISIARAIVGHPQVLLLDEATSALDSETEQVLLQALKKLSQTMIIIIVTHNNAALEYADVTYQM